MLVNTNIKNSNFMLIVLIDFMLMKGTNRSVGVMMLIHHGTRVRSATGDRVLFNSLSEVFNCSQQMAQHCCRWIGYCTTYGHKVLNVVFLK